MDSAKETAVGRNLEIPSRDSKPQEGITCVIQPFCCPLRGVRTQTEFINDRRKDVSDQGSLKV